MNCYFDKALAEEYKSRSQKARVLTEGWVAANLYCPRCGNPELRQFPRNEKVADFFCPECSGEYELKSKSGRIGNKIADGAYDTFIQRIESTNNPDFLVMSYDSVELCVDHLWIVPKYFFTPSIVEKRKALSDHARRAGWVGCNIIYSDIPSQGRIGIINNRTAVEKNEVLANVRRSATLFVRDIEARGWLFEVLNCVNRIPQDTFSLQELYQFEGDLQKLHPRNANVRPKIRQKLQELRDAGFLEFLGRGQYRKIRSYRQ